MHALLIAYSRDKPWQKAETAKQASARAQEPWSWGYLCYSIVLQLCSCFVGPYDSQATLLWKIETCEEFIFLSLSCREGERHWKVRLSSLALLITFHSSVDKMNVLSILQAVWRKVFCQTRLTNSSAPSTSSWDFMKQWIWCFVPDGTPSTVPL